MAQRDDASNPPPLTDQMARSSRKKQRVPSLSEDLIVEILSRVPYRSLCRFKCVSRSWLALCSDPDLRKKSPQTLSGFFCFSRHEDDETSLNSLRFLNLSGRGRPLVDPSPPLLEGYARPPCSWSAAAAFSSGKSGGDRLRSSQKARHTLSCVRLGFGPAVPSCFYVFMFVTDECPPDECFRVTGVEIYSSGTGGWVFRQDDETRLEFDAGAIFFNGTLYSITTDLLLASVDTEGKTWGKIRMPHSYIRSRLRMDDCFIAHSQGRLYAMHMDFRNDNQLSVWALGANGNEQWALEHTANITQLLGRHHRSRYKFYVLVAAHPERNLIFLTGGLRDELMSYDMDKQEVHTICTLQEYFLAPCFPYSLLCGMVFASSDGH
ncbi:F-box protein [Panicum miliaceum]|uniref:F-box protein n=1 Tax=Panicum miliaceum TaxID=4540 RepID=A0A3L6STT8_PANMI|nr:F-box protein [Panicum miliaceum]